MEGHLGFAVGGDGRRRQRGGEDVAGREGFRPTARGIPHAAAEEERGEFVVRGTRAFRRRRLADDQLPEVVDPGIGQEHVVEDPPVVVARQIGDFRAVLEALHIQQNPFHGGRGEAKPGGLRIVGGVAEVEQAVQGQAIELRAAEKDCRQHEDRQGRPDAGGFQAAVFEALAVFVLQHLQVHQEKERRRQDQEARAHGDDRQQRKREEGEEEDEEVERKGKEHQAACALRRFQAGVLERGREEEEGVEHGQPIDPRALEVCRKGDGAVEQQAAAGEDQRHQGDVEWAEEGMLLAFPDEQAFDDERHPEETEEEADRKKRQKDETQKAMEPSSHMKHIQEKVGQRRH